MIPEVHGLPGSAGGKGAMSLPARKSGKILTDIYRANPTFGDNSPQNDADVDHVVVVAFRIKFQRSQMERHRVGTGVAQTRQALLRARAAGVCPSA
jgi:hypothetical protein